MKSKLDKMQVVISYSDKKINKDRLFKIFYDIIEEQEAKEEREKELNNKKIKDK